METTLHQALHTFDFREAENAVTFLSLVLTDAPTETDVFFAITRPPVEDNHVRHYIVTEEWVYLLADTGIIAQIPMERWEEMSR